MLVVMLAIAAATYAYVDGQRVDDRLLTPVMVAAIMVANLVPAMALVVMIGSRIARARAERTMDGGNGRLHIRLVGLFSLTSAVPTLLVAIFASLLFQLGVDFWFSDRSRGMFENAAELAEGYYQENQREVGANAVAMASDLRSALTRVDLDNPAFSDYYLQQVVVRNLNGSAIVEIGRDGVARTPALVDPDNRSADSRISPATLARLDAGEAVVVARRGDRIEAATRLDAARRVYLYVSRDSQVLGLQQFQRAQTVLRDYDGLSAQSRRMQLQFNLALYLAALALVLIAVAAAIIVADRIVRPLGKLAGAARTAADGDLSVRVDPGIRGDEIAVLAEAFNSMTVKLQGQTRALLHANNQLDARRAFMETLLSGVSAGVISLDSMGRVRLANAAAQALLATDAGVLEGQPLSQFSPELAALCGPGRREAVLALTAPGGEDMVTLAAKAVPLNDGHVLTFEDITQQLSDQRRAAWSDVARRIAHEIKNPLTPIQLAAERLQRRFGHQAGDDEQVFRKLTDTIVRQVSDVRRMVDEFSSFARMPAPTFGEEDLVDIVSRSAFLFEVAYPDIEFSLDKGPGTFLMQCDQRLLAQAFTNIIKNAMEAIVEKRTASEDDAEIGRIAIGINADDPGEVVVMIDDNGIGLPPQRDSIAEPYMTTRKGGTGLGLAIVKKIIEDHFGEIEFADSPLGGARVTVRLRPGHLLAGRTGALPDHDAAGIDARPAAAEPVPGRIRTHPRPTDGPDHAA